jgi:Mg-chelatase subunit ChlD
MLENRDYTLIIDKSGSMATKDDPHGPSRWQIMQESALALASKCEEFDPDGITVYLFSGKFKRYDNVTSTKVAQIFQENDPSGRTDLAGVLTDAFNNFLTRKKSGQIKTGETILVVTDGEPDDRKAVMKVIIETSQQLSQDEELAISFIQVGTDSDATKFLKILDDQLQSAGAKFDIVDTITLDDMEDLTLKEVLLNAIID